jgi:hypothetical protein
MHKRFLATSRKLILFFTKKNNGVATLFACCILVSVVVAMQMHGIPGLKPFYSIGGFALIMASIFI